jgi:hypothetical protein
MNQTKKWFTVIAAVMAVIIVVVGITLFNVDRNDHTNKNIPNSQSKDLSQYISTVIEKLNLNSQFNIIVYPIPNQLYK